MRCLSFFYYLAPIVEKFITDTSDRYRIDLSHNLHHSLRVKEVGFLIAKNDYSLSKRQQQVLYLSCMLHDMCDPKYMPVPQSILDVSRFIKEKCLVPMMVHDGVMNIITSMSYSKVVQADGRVEYPVWLWKEKNFKDVYHITREADLLTSYDVKRMVHYKHEKLGMVYSSDMYKDILDTVDQRMSRLLEKNLFHSPTAKKMAKQWHYELCEEVLPRLTADDMYPLLNEPPETLEQFQQRLLLFVA